MRLVVKNTVVISLLIAISMISISAFGYMKAKAFIYERFEDQAYNQLESVKANIDLWIKGKKEIVEYMAEADELKIGNTEKADALGIRIAEKFNNPDAFAFMDADGYLYLGGSKIPVHDFEHFIGGMNAQTNAYDPVPSESPGLNGAPIVLASSPIYDYNDEIVGVASGGYPIENLMNIISNITLGDSGYVTVFTKDGTIVAGQNKEDTLNKNISDYHNSDLNELVKKSLSDETGVIETKLDDENSLVFYSKASEMDWGIMISVPTSEPYADANSLLNYFVIITILFILLSALISYLINNRSLKPIKEVSEKVEELAGNGGDLTKRLTVTRKDEVGKLASNFNSLLDSLQNLIGDILAKGEVVSKNTSDLSHSAEEVVQLSGSVTENVHNASALSTVQEEGNKKNLESVNGITQSVAEIKEHSSLVSKKTKHAYKEVKDTNEDIKAMISQMGKIQESVQRSADIVRKLGNRSNEIGTIVGMITAITEQTNLLALNASIEAARAGEHGKGFAVVADEVKKLAEQSAQSAKQISDLVSEIQTETSTAAVEMETGSNQFGKGMSQLDVVSRSLQTVYQASEATSNEVDAIFIEIENLLTKVKDVEHVIHNNSDKSLESSKYIREVAASSEEQLSSIQEITASIEKTAQFAEELRGLLNQFKI